MSEVTLRQLEYFVAVAEEESITRAALKCHVTQAGISLALKDLEAALGVPLAIRRKSKGLFLTPAGREVAKRAAALLANARSLAHTFIDESAAYTGTFTLGVTLTLSRSVFPPAADWFAAHHPGVTLQVVEGDALDLQERLLQGQLDICFINEAQQHAEVDAHLIRERHYLVMLSPSHPLAELDVLTLRDLAPHPAAMVNVVPASYLNINLLRTAGLDPNIKYASASMETLRALVARGLAYAILLEPVAKSHEGMPLVHRRVAELSGTNSLMAAFPQSIPPSRLARELMDHLRSVITA